MIGGKSSNLAMCSCDKKSGRIYVALIIALICYFIPLLTLSIIGGELTIDDLNVFGVLEIVYNYSGTFIGYFTINEYFMYILLLFVGGVIGMVSLHPLKATLTVAAFFFIQLLLFLVIGLMLLGFSYDFVALWNSIEGRFVWAIIFLFIPAIIVSTIAGKSVKPQKMFSIGKLPTPE